jgi:hypothetical protein
MELLIEEIFILHKGTVPLKVTLSDKFDGQNYEYPLNVHLLSE